MTQFATPFELPVSFSGYPVGLAVAVPETRQQLYVEREYVGTSVIRSTPIQEAGFVYWTEASIPEGTKEIRVSVVNYDRKTEADPVATPAATQGVRKFSTALDRPVLFGGYPVSLGIGVSQTRQTLYLDREYRVNGITLAIRSDIIYDRGVVAHFNVQEAPAPYGTKEILVSIRNEYRATESDTLEYTQQEHNALEYN
jgi:hypothetical protein